MSRIAYVNGRYLPHKNASVHVEDRGFQFSDGVYEVCEVRYRNLLDVTRHMDRLERSLRELQIAMPLHRNCLIEILREVARRNRVTNGLVYIQVTRGASPRNHLFPPSSVKSTLVVTGRNANFEMADELATKGIAVVSVADNRWDRVDIKSVGLLPNVLAKQQAHERGAGEAWFVDEDGFVTEGSSTNAWIVTKDSVLVTRPVSNGILKGITRTRVMEMAENLGLVVEQRAFTLEEAKQAKEAFVTAATSVVMPVVSIDGSVVANGHPGSIAARLRALFFSTSEKLPC